MENKEYYKNGNLAYEETIVDVEFDIKIFPNCRMRSDGSHFIRVGRNAKYHPNGQLNWLLNYDQYGNVIKEHNPSYRSDGSIIQYSR